MPKVLLHMIPAASLCYDLRVRGFLHVRASLCSAKVLFCLDDFGVELLVLAHRLLMKTRVLVRAESFLHSRTLARLIKLSIRWLLHERAP
jgi:hypothetical protein